MQIYQLPAFLFLNTAQSYFQATNTVLCWKLFTSYITRLLPPEAIAIKRTASINLALSQRYLYSVQRGSEPMLCVFFFRVAQTASPCPAFMAPPSDTPPTISSHRPFCRLVLFMALPNKLYSKTTTPTHTKQSFLKTKPQEPDDNKFVVIGSQNT